MVAAPTMVTFGNTVGARVGDRVGQRRSQISLAGIFDQKSPMCLLQSERPFACKQIYISAYLLAHYVSI